MRFFEKLGNRIDTYRNSRYERAAIEAETRLRRLTANGLDPEDPNDALMIGMFERLDKQQAQARNRKRVETIKQIAYRLMEMEVMQQAPAHRISHACDTVTRLHYKIAQDIYDSVERISQDLEYQAEVTAKRTETTSKT